MKLLNFICVFITYFLIPTIALDGKLCQKEISYPVEIKVPTTEPFVVRTFKWCAKPPFRCPTTRVAYRSSYKIETQEQKKIVFECCEGYSDFRNICKPICDEDCIHGICVAPSVCECEPGWSGSSCSTICSNNKWGPKCMNDCLCQNGGNCDPITGHCSCRDGFYGPVCSRTCECPSENYVCNSTVGCVCRHGVLGANCTELSPSLNVLAYGASQNYNDVKDNNVLVVTMFCILAIAIIAFSVFMVLRYKSKVRKLENELSYVTYTNERPQVDQFENLIYSYQPSTCASKLENTENKMFIRNNCVLNNDLSFCKNNIEKAKLGETEYDVGASKSSNNEYNYNIYNSIDDFKGYTDKEPIYDEINPKVETDNINHDSYDHLQYDTPRPFINNMSASVDGFTPEKPLNT